MWWLGDRCSWMPKCWGWLALLLLCHISTQADGKIWRNENGKCVFLNLLIVIAKVPLARTKLTAQVVDDAKDLNKSIAEIVDSHKAEVPISPILETRISVLYPSSVCQALGTPSKIWNAKPNGKLFLFGGRNFFNQKFVGKKKITTVFVEQPLASPGSAKYSNIEI